MRVYLVDQGYIASKGETFKINKPILVGQVLKVSVITDEPPTAELSTVIHTVQSGDTLWKIAQNNDPKDCRS